MNNWLLFNLQKDLDIPLSLFILLMTKLKKISKYKPVKIICNNCTGVGLISSCCISEFSEENKLKTKTKCNTCGKFCETKACSECGGFGFTDEEDE